MSAAVEAMPWTKQVLGLLNAVEKGELPVPIALSWDPHRRELGVQVEEDGYRAWLDAILSPVVSSAPHEDVILLYAQGELRHSRMVHVRLVSVCHQATRPDRAVTP